MAVLDLPAPTAARLRRPGWRDPRLLVGVALVASSVLLGSWAVRSAQGTVPVYAARDTLTPGDPVDSDALVVADVRLGEVGDGRYLRADEPLPDDLVTLRTVGAGELVPVAALGPAEAVDTRPVAVPLSRPPSAAVVVGAAVDLWVVPRGSSRSDASTAGPRAVATGLTVAEVTGGSGGLGATTTAAVQVLVPVEDLPDVLAALADGDVQVEVVPVPGAA